MKIFSQIDSYVIRNHGTSRGLIRLFLDTIVFYLGIFRHYDHVDWSRVERLVFVCQGNICRSPFAHFLADRLINAYPVASIGLSTTTGLPAYETGCDVAKEFAVDLSKHAATDFADFDIREGDLFLVMEYRHVRQLKKKMPGIQPQIALLGLWCRPRFALLYDPHRLSRTYFQTCFRRIENAVKNLADEIG